jgi:hypothetical protein
MVAYPIPGEIMTTQRPESDRDMVARSTVAVFEPQLTDASAGRAVKAMMAANDRALVDRSMLPAVFVTQNPVRSEAQKVATIDSLQSLLSSRFAELDADHKGGIGLNDLKAAASNRKYSEKERELFQFAVDNFDQLKNLYPYNRTKDGTHYRVAGSTINRFDLQVMHTAMHPDSEMDPWRSDELRSETIAGGIPGIFGLVIGSGLAGPIAGIGLGALASGIGASSYLGVERLIYGSPERFYARQRQKLLTSLRY